MSLSPAAAAQVPVHYETDPAHKRVLVDKFSTDADYWRKVYEDAPDAETNFNASEIVDRKKAVLGFVDAYAGNRDLAILDVGCGTGMTLRDLLRRGHSVVGADITEAMLHRARAAVSEFPADRARCIRSDVENVPFEDGSFDVVLCMGVLQYLQTDAKAVSELSRVVRNGGLAIVTLPNLVKLNNLIDPYYYFVRAAQYLARVRRGKRYEDLSPDDFESNRRFANRRYYYGQLSSLFENNGLTQVGVAAIAFGPLTLWGKPLLSLATSIRISRFVQRLAQKRYLAFLKVLANRWVFCLRKGESPRRSHA
jgi:ubiquinone/menaquinone biosynthesis C-methylase UbiE